MKKSFPLIKAGTYLGSRWLANRVANADRLPKHGAVIITPNHSSLLDGVLLTSMINMNRFSPCHTIVQKESFDNKFFGYILRSGKCIPVDRQCKQSIVDMFRLALAYLDKDEQVMIFPEGHLNNGKSLRLPRPGAALLALESGAPVLPVGLKGTRDIHAIGEGFNFKARAQVNYGKLIYTAELSKEYHSSNKERRKQLIDDLSLRVMKQIAELSGLELHRRMK